jgi:methyl-accepting chemotaxis protein
MPFSGIFTSSQAQNSHNVLNALTKSMAIIEFSLDGKVLSANENFLTVMGYTIDEIVGKHHSMFVPAEMRDTQEYRDFWKNLQSGKFQRAAFPRIAKDGRRVWLEASYNPVFDAKGNLLKVVKLASDITARRNENAEMKGVIDAIDRSQAVIEFDLHGKILTANSNFLDVMGYRLDEIQGKSHAMFVESDYGKSPEYKKFWEELRNGKFQAQQFKRLGKGGKQVWIEGSYNPIMDADGKPYKVVKFATDVTEQVTLLIELKSMIDNNFGEIDQSMTSLEEKAGMAVSASAQTSSNVQAVAAGAEELSASIAEISRSMAEAREVTEQVFQQTVSADASTQRMNDVVSAMGNIVEMIQGIAGQINLLALNATIESARAGEAGKGFAVVANEVKNLANQAAKATDQISTEINGIQSIAVEVADVLGSIRTSVETVRDNVVTISSAVEEQSAVTSEVSHNMQSMAAGVEQFSANIGDIQHSASDVANSIDRTREAAEILAR